MKVVYPEKAPVKKAPPKKKVVKKKVVKKKVVKTERPGTKYLSPKKAGIKKRKTSIKPKPVPPPPDTTTTVAKAETTTVPTTTTAPKAITGTNYVVSVASFKERSKAEPLRAKLANGGHMAYISKTFVKGTTWYRVRVGFFAGFSEANKVKASIAKSYSATGAWVDKPTSAEVAEFAK